MWEEQDTGVSMLTPGSSPAWAVAPRVEMDGGIHILHGTAALPQLPLDTVLSCHPSSPVLAKVLDKQAICDIECCNDPKKGLGQNNLCYG